MRGYRDARSTTTSSAEGAVRGAGVPGKQTLTADLDTNRQPEAPQVSQSTGAPAQPAQTGAPTEGPAGTGGPDTNAPPVEQYVIPFDHNPKSAPGEQIIFGATYTHATPNDYKLVYTSAGGHFDAQGSNVTTKTINGLNARNIYWFIASNWDGRTAVTMKLELKKTDDTVVATTNWAFSKKAYHPTTITQQETEGERDNPAVYRYKLGPSRNSGGDDYLGFTILEKFAGPYTTNLKLTDLKPTYVQAQALSSDAAIAPHFFPGTGDNGTFTASAGDLIADQHGGMSGADQAKAQLAAPKEIQKLLTQTYESETGTALATYQITRVMKLDGSKKITKKKV